MAFAFTFCKGFTAMAARNGSHNEEPQSGAFDLSGGLTVHAMEPLEYAL
jgi:hypothetical protein